MKNEHAWAAFVKLAKNSDALTFDDMPFLKQDFSFSDIFGVEADAPMEEKKVNVRLVLLRWHPDKFKQGECGERAG